MEIKPVADPYGTAEIHAYYLPVMDDFHRYCIEHGIKYSLSGGSLLGAVRHKGFIPWDDDVDVMFDRQNYDLFLSCFRVSPMDGYEIVGDSWVKRLSRKDNPRKAEEELCLDLFVFDPVPERYISEKGKIFFIKTLQGMLKDKPEYERFSLPYQCLLFGTWLLGRPFPRSVKLKWYTNVSRMGKNYHKVNVYNTWFNQVGKLTFDKSILDDYVLLDFEGRKYMAIVGYDSYLSTLYGDYMKLPPEDKRVPTHQK